MIGDRPPTGFPLVRLKGPLEEATICWPRGDRVDAAASSVVSEARTADDTAQLLDELAERGRGDAVTGLACQVPARPMAFDVGGPIEAARFERSGARTTQRSGRAPSKSVVSTDAILFVVDRCGVE